VTTDSGSAKVQHLRANNRTEICWYFALTREQYRIAGAVTLVDADSSDEQQIRKQVWDELSPGTRGLFLDDPSAEPSIEPPAAFVLAMILPSQVRYLDLRSNEAAERVLFSAADPRQVRQ
jgi:hypothetical protein